MAGLAGCRDGTKSEPVGGPTTGDSVDTRITGGGSGDPTDQLEEDEPLLLLDEPGEGSSPGPPPEGTLADNSRCHVCHANFQDERLVLVHAHNEVGCETCHGPSDAHCSDEDNVTAPDKMHARQKIRSFCQGCHLQLSPDHEAYLAPVAEEKVCTDCHEFEKHRLAHRTRVWDKSTGRLLKSDGVRMDADGQGE